MVLHAHVNSLLIEVSKMRKTHNKSRMRDRNDRAKFKRMPSTENKGSRIANIPKSFFELTSNRIKLLQGWNAGSVRNPMIASTDFKNLAGSTRMMYVAIDQDTLQIMDESNSLWAEAWKNAVRRASAGEGI